MDYSISGVKDYMAVVMLLSFWLLLVKGFGGLGLVWIVSSFFLCCSMLVMADM